MKKDCKAKKNVLRSFFAVKKQQFVDILAHSRKFS